MYDRAFMCQDCSVSYTMTYETKTGAANARRTRCPKCQRVHELLRKRKNGSQIDFQETKTENPAPELPKNDATISQIEEESAIQVKVQPEPAKPVKIEPPKPAYKYQVDDPILSSMEKRIPLHLMRSDEKTSLQNAVAYGRSFRKEKNDL